MQPIATFSIVAYDPGREEWGVAVQSKFMAVGAVVPWARAGAGAVATQSYANLRYGPDGLDLMQQGLSAEEAIARLTQAHVLIGIPSGAPSLTVETRGGELTVG